MQAAAIAAHRFGFSETSLTTLQRDPRGWVRAQFREPAAPDDAGLPGSAEALRLGRRALQAAQLPARTATVGVAASALTMGSAGASTDGAGTGTATGPGANPASAAGTGTVAAGPASVDAARRELREVVGRAALRRWQHVVATPTPVFERWVMFWANHFCVAATKGTTLGLVAPHEAEAIRPHATGSFATLLRAATLHPAMLLYLDNAQSVGPNSAAGRRRARGLNENLARELLELHTLGVRGGYTQADVGELARLLTGWTVPRANAASADAAGGGRDTAFARFDPALHEPGPKVVLGRTYAEGPQAVDALCTDLARHPSTARFVATKLARHFVADDPPAALVDAVAARFRATDGDLLAVADTLFGHDAAWQPSMPPKFKRPDEWLLSAHRVLKLPVLQPARLFAALAAMGQPVGRAPSPAGWPDRSDDWLSPDALWKRVEWAGAFADVHAGRADARQLAALSHGADLSAATRSQIDRAASGAQALALWLASPEFQRR